MTQLHSTGKHDVSPLYVCQTNAGWRYAFLHHLRRFVWSTIRIGPEKIHNKWRAENTDVDCRQVLGGSDQSWHPKAMNFRDIVFLQPKGNTSFLMKQPLKSQNLDRRPSTGGENGSVVAVAHLSDDLYTLIISKLSRAKLRFSLPFVHDHSITQRISFGQRPHDAADRRCNTGCGSGNSQPHLPPQPRQPVSLRRHSQHQHRRACDAATHPLAERCVLGFAGCCDKSIRRSRWLLIFSSTTLPCLRSAR